MIVGEYNNHAPRIALNVTGKMGSREVTFVLDTGFEGEIVLSSSLLRAIGGEQSGSQVRMLADGSTVECEVCYVVVDWDGKPRRVSALALEGNSLLGVEMFENWHLDIEATEGGEVLIERL